MSPASTTSRASTALRLRLTRDHDPVTSTIAGVDLGQVDLDEPVGAAAARWFADGVRQVTLDQPVDLTASTATGAAEAVDGLAMVRELTSHGFAVRWSLRMAGGPDCPVSSLQHLRPPTTLTLTEAGDAEAKAALRTWTSAYYFDQCTYRRGPGFVQVRDRRTGELNLITIDDPAYLAVLSALEFGAESTEVDLDIARQFAAEGLVLKVDTLLLWLPYRLRRWPLPTMLV